MKFAKYHALGNDYVVVADTDWPASYGPGEVRRICDRHCGAGSDGVLLGSLRGEDGLFPVRIFNPDGSEAERSGNGVRIFARYLCDRGLAPAAFSVGTLAGAVEIEMLADGRVRAEMGRATFDSARVPVSGAPREVLDEEIEAAGRRYRFAAVSVGNPHCVIRVRNLSREELLAAGPEIERSPAFPHRTNVQMMEVLSPGALRIEIWERGAGYTVSSGSSACAAAAAARRLGLCDPRVEVVMPGGSLEVEVAPDFGVRQTGPVEHVYDGDLDERSLR